MDDVANYAAGPPTASSCVPSTPGRRLCHLMVQMAETDLEAVKVLREAVGAMERDFREALTIAAEIDKIESRVDDIFARSTAPCSTWKRTSRRSTS